MTDRSSRTQGPAQPVPTTALAPTVSRSRMFPTSVSGSAPPTVHGPWPEPALPQSFAVSSAPVSPSYNVQHSWSQTQYFAPSTSQLDVTQIPSYTSPPPLQALTSSLPVLKPLSLPTGYSGLPQSSVSAFLPVTGVSHHPSSVQASSTGLSYASSHHRPPTRTPILPSVRASPVSIHPPPSSQHLPSHHSPSPPVSIRPPPRLNDPIAPIPLRPIPFNNLARPITPSFHTPAAPAPPYLQFNPNPVPIHSPYSPHPSPSTPESYFRPLSVSSLHFPHRPNSAPIQPLTPLSLRMHNLPLSLPGSPAPGAPLPLAPIPPVHRSTSTYTKPDFPNLSSIPLLSTANDWAKWYSAVMQVIEATGLYDHIVDVLPADVLLDPTAYPSLPPVIDRAHFTPEELDAYRSWWTQDDIVSFVLVGKLGPIPASLIPPKRDAWGNPQRSARDILRILRTQYGVFDATSAALVRESTLSKKVIGNDVSSYVDMWRKAVLQVEGSHWDFSSYEKVQRFADGLPRTYEYEPLRVLIREGFNTHPPHGVITFHDASQAALNVELASRRLSNTHGTTPRRSQPSTSTSTSTPTSSQNPATTSATDPVVPTATATRPRCSNCGALGHVAGNCWEPGGGDVGGRDRYLAANPPRPRAHIAVASDPSLEPIVESVESEIESAPAPISVYSSSEPQPTPPSDTAFYLDFANAASPVVLASIADRFNAILDSGCTVHIIRDRKYFWSYDTSLAVPVGTANCGTLSTLAKGEVRFRILLDGQEQIICLRDCLHAPDVSINLISVGSLTEKDMRLVFEKNITSIHLPDSLSTISDLTINATVVRRLSCLHLDFVLPSNPSISRKLDDYLVLPAIEQLDSDLGFPHVPLTPHLWHRRFGHLGLDATRAVLTKSYATGIKYDGPFTDTHCIPCLIGKHPQRPFDHLARRVTQVCDLLHMDTCGPFPVQTPHGKIFFHTILDDHSNYGC
ncbi:hypothetical protein D9615_006100 [Tricholomella constricta]|uniref:CCHC-type domain-containing protein n=1 Tax=Tricholomella constricta TaxID=117010 RepID=A0A8H5M485_9AGAR|nr:hypothetical protein D9615_006100 [Tricholomella constricta]